MRSSEQGSSRPLGDMRLRFGTPALVLFLLLLAFLGFAAALNRFGGSSAAQTVLRRVETSQISPWWRTRFPPVAVASHTTVRNVEFVPANVLTDFNAGSLDGGELTEGTGVFLWGFALDPRTGSPPLGVFLIDNGRPIHPAVCVFRDRADVAAFFKNARLIPSGWNVWLPVSKLESGEHIFEAFALLSDHKLGSLAGKVRINIKGDASEQN